MGPHGRGYGAPSGVAELNAEALGFTARVWSGRTQHGGPSIRSGSERLHTDLWWGKAQPTTYSGWYVPLASIFFLPKGGIYHF